ncbi:hypothetical protein DY000_02040815 [Brassica cretica]|uniref:Transmembrane protein n=1 Tax=Brassica cretica TaxID=69181 RepID=A0ABQ7BKH5_BRACR|nr:hypothetical protein DY000_02040815 [Brassica cretica]
MAKSNITPLERRDDFVDEEERNTNEEKKIVGGGGGEERGENILKYILRDLGSSFSFLFYVLYAVWLVSPWIVKLPITDGVRILEFGSNGSIVVVTVLSSCRMVFPAQFNGFGASTLLSYCRWKSFGQISSSFGFLFYVLYAVWLVSPWIVKLPITDGVRILEFGSNGSIVVVTVLSSCRMVFPAQFNGFGASTLLSY